MRIFYSSFSFQATSLLASFCVLEAENNREGVWTVKKHGNEQRLNRSQLLWCWKHCEVILDNLKPLKFVNTFFRPQVNKSHLSFVPPSNRNNQACSRLLTVTVDLWLLQAMHHERNCSKSLDNIIHFKYSDF